MDSGDLVPDDFDVPATLETNKYRLRKLTLEDGVKDYDAVMTSIEHLHNVFSPADDWPHPDMSLHQDMVDLGWHQREFEMRRSFAYTVMALDESHCLGCVYIYSAKGFDAKVFCWVRASEVGRGLDDDLYQTVTTWIKKSWPFDSVAYPGRATSWEDFEATAAKT